MSETNPYGWPQPQAGSQPPPYRPVGAPDPGKRPGTVTAAAVITIVSSALVLLAGVACMILGAVGSDTFYDGIRDGGRGAYDDFDNDDLQTLLLAIGIVLAVWSALAILLGVLVLRRSSVARVLLVISAGLSLVFSLIAILSLVSALTLIAAITAIVLLFVGGANDWFAGRSPAPQWS